ncbi:MAG TPA: hypothetical protein VH502_12250, partial [Actinoplanes sp.]
MESAMHSFLVSIPQAAAIWITMLLAVAVAVTVLARPGRAVAPADPTIDAASSRAVAPDPTIDAASSRIDAASLRDLGVVVGTEADVARERATTTPRSGREEEGAAATAAHHRAAWEVAREEVDAAWAAYDDADRAARRTAAASAFRAPARRGPGENADRERYLHRTATAACRRREISIKQLNEALAHRGWNPRLHPVAQEAALCNAIREHRLAAYRAATAREQEAWHAAEAAAAALSGLR